MVTLRDAIAISYDVITTTYDVITVPCDVITAPHDVIITPYDVITTPRDVILSSHMISSLYDYTSDIFTHSNTAVRLAAQFEEKALEKADQPSGQTNSLLR